MLALRDPHDAYRRVEFDARVASARPEQLVALCFQELATALGSAIRSHELGDNQRRSAGSQCSAMRPFSMRKSEMRRIRRRVRQR